MLESVRELDCGDGSHMMAMLDRRDTKQAFTRGIVEMVARFNCSISLGSDILFLFPLSMQLAARLAHDS